MFYRLFILVMLVGAVAACASIQRSDDAAEAKVHMVGMTREDVLACMGPPKKKASVEATEVWSYVSRDGSSESMGNSYKIGGLTTHESTHDKGFCTVNVVMKEGAVTRVNYNGPSGGYFAPNEQCGYAVANCVDGNRF
jgi:outer membrane protein assembly factor BamE (lipoprotein component of BamABCDE complex)